MLAVPFLQAFAAVATAVMRTIDHHIGRSLVGFMLDGLFGVRRTELAWSNRLRPDRFEKYFERAIARVDPDRLFGRAEAL